MESAHPSKHAAAFSQLGSIALGNAGLGFLFKRATEVVRDLLGAGCSEIHKVADTKMVVVGRAGFSEGAEAIEERAALARLALGSQDAIAIAPAGISAAIMSSDQQPWGAITAWMAEPRAMTASDADFLRTIANLIAQAIDRRRSEVELQIRATQQSALAEMARLTSSGITDATLGRACELAMQSLAVEHAYVFRPSADGALVFAAGSDSPLPVAARHAAQVAESQESSVLVDRNELNGVATPMQAGHRNFGVLGGYTTVAKSFTAADVQFMESLALIIAEAADREAARAELSESEQRFRNVVEGASEVIFSIAPTGEFRSLNPAFEAVTGWRVEEWLGRPFIELVVPEQREAKLDLFGSVLREPRHVRMALSLIGKSRVVLVDVASSPRVVDGEVVEIYGFARDITEEQRLHRKLEQANRLSSLGRLAATVAHEFNNVLMGISPFTELLRHETLSERARSALDQIAHSVKRGKRTTEDILRFAQPAEPAMVTLPVAALLGSIATEAGSLIGPKYSIEVAADDAIEIGGDAPQLHQAFVNLILNARDAMPEGGRITIGARRERAEARFDFGVIEQPESFAHFTVSDEGTGMRPETLDHIFEPLFTTKKNGTGLGLPVARQVVTRHGGEIFVETAPDRGTTFHLFIPLALRSQHLPSEVPPSRDRTCRSILLVEDEPQVAMGIAALLELEGVVVRTVDNGRAVLPSIAEARPDAVVLDIGLPDIDGTAVYESIASKYPDLPVVFSSGHGDATKLDRYLANPNVRFLLKPYEIEELLQMLDRVVS